MNYKEALAEAVLDFVESTGAMEELAKSMVNDTSEDVSLGYYDESDAKTAVISAAFHMLGQEILEQCSPRATAKFGASLINLRDNLLAAMKAGY
jgi:hypothetical protein